MIQTIKKYIPIRRMKDLLSLLSDFTKKCNDDHVTAFGSMAAFFILLSLIPFMIFFLTMTQFLPFTKNDIETILTSLVSFERSSLIRSIINEVYHKTDTSVFTVSIIAALWSSSRGIFSIVKGLNSVYDIEDRRNYFVLRLFSMLYTVLFSFVIVAMLLLWVFGNQLSNYLSQKFPPFATVIDLVINRGSIVTFVVLALIFMLIYYFIPGRASYFIKQIPGAILAALGWIVISKLCAFYIEHFSNFTYIYGSMAGVMILIIWMYFCMTFIFYGAEINYFLENKDNYHALIRVFRPRYARLRRHREDELKKQKQEEKEKIKKEQQEAMEKAKQEQQEAIEKAKKEWLEKHTK